jgi:predicted transcriptional regulator
MLHELEAEIMEEVWRQGETNVKRVMEALNRKANPPRAYTTYMTVMRRLDDKSDVALAQFAKSIGELDPARRRQLRRLADSEQ